MKYLLSIVFSCGYSIGTRQPQIDKLWLKLIDNELEVKHVCHVGIDGGYESVMYLEGESIDFTFFIFF